MGAELSKATGEGKAPLSNASTSSIGLDPTQVRRLDSNGGLMKQQSRKGDLPLSASTNSLASMVNPANGEESRNAVRRNSLNTASSHSASGSSHFGARLLDSGIFSSKRRNSNSRTPTHDGHHGSFEEHAVESLDLPIVEWEGYATKKGHLVRNWKMRFFTLEGNNLSYYESKVDARNRTHLKGRVTVTSVKVEKVSKSGNGYEFSFDTAEGKVFQCCVPTQLDQLTWVYFMEAGVDCSNMRKNSKPIYNTYRHGALPDMTTAAAYELYQRLMNGQVELINELMSYFNKDLVFSSSYPKSTPFHGDYFGREGFLHFLGSYYHNVQLLEFSVDDIIGDADGKTFTIRGHEKIKGKFSDTIISQPWTHRIRYGPYGRILRLRLDIDLKASSGNWKQFATKNPYHEVCDAAFRSTRSLSISMKDFTVYNVIGKGGFGTVVNAVKKSDGQIYALKILEKGKMTKYDIESSFTEMRVAQNIHHPFIAGLRIAFQSRTKLFLGMNYYGGGDLFHHMSKGSSCRIPADRAHFYTAELVLGIHHLHQHDILYRDIKPENVMIDSDGHIALVDFGLAKLHVSNFQGAKTMAGSPQYTAPELLLSKSKRSYGKAADWWSLGILLYEMSVGNSPFYDNNIEKMYQKIQNDPLTFPEKPALSDELKDILMGFLQKDPTKRLGSNISDILAHKYFASIDWDLLLQKKVSPPWKPKLVSPLDVEYVDTEFTEMDVHKEVQSPTDKSSRSKGFLSTFVSSRGARKHTPPVQDPTFKDFTYYCEDPDALVEVENLVDELHPQPPPPPPQCEAVVSSEPIDVDLDVQLPDSSGTPLSSFVESGKLLHSPEQLRQDMKMLEAAMVEQFQQVEVTISRERPATLRTQSSDNVSDQGENRTEYHYRSQNNSVDDAPITSTDVSASPAHVITPSTQ